MFYENRYENRPIINVIGEGKILKNLRTILMLEVVASKNY
jgi:hypothetical protein